MSTKLKGQTVRVTLKDKKVFEGKCRSNTASRIIVQTPMIASLEIPKEDVLDIEIIEPKPLFGFFKK